MYMFDCYENDGTIYFSFAQRLTEKNKFTK